MKKSAIALAVAGATSLSALSTTAVAETTFYGSVRATVLYTEPAFGDSTWDVGDGGTRWGVKGSQDLGNGLSAIYHIETELDADTYNGGRQKGRLAWVGLKGGFGSVTIGSQWSPYYNVAGRADIFNDAGWYAYYQGPFRIKNSIVYGTPDSISSFKGEVAMVMDGETELSSKDVDEWQIGANVSFGPFGGGAAYRYIDLGKDSGGNDFKTWTVTGSFDFAGASIAAMYERTNVGGDTTGLIDDADTIYLTAQYTFGNNILKAGWGKLNPGGNSDINNMDQWAIGIQHNLNKRTRMWLEYAQTDDFLCDNIDDNAFCDDDDSSKVSLGLRHDF